VKILTCTAIVLLIYFISGCAELPFFDEKISFFSPRKPQWKITLEGPFTTVKTVKPGEVVFKYYGSHIYNPQEINYFSQYTYSGKKDLHTIELVYTEGGTVLDEEKEERITIHMYDRRIFNRSPLKTPYLYTTCKRKDVVLIEMIELDKEELTYRIILPDCLDEVIRKRQEELEKQRESDDDADSYID
jgi:hypothetical protein